MSGPRLVRVRTGRDGFEVELTDGRVFAVEYRLASERLAVAPRGARENCVIKSKGRGIHWPDIDEDLSTAGLVRDWCRT